MSHFCHLHCHTSFSLLDGAASIDTLVKKASVLEIPALGITDHGNLYGVPEFYFTCKDAGITPVIGCEFYLCATPMGEREDRVRYHQVLWAKSEIGYRNLITLSNQSFLNGFYYKPRIDFDTLARHSEGLVATTCCLQGEVPQRLLAGQEKEARIIFERYREVFGDDYYIELQNHGIDDQRRVNEVLMRWAQELSVPVVATNDVHYVEQTDYEAQDILLCLQTDKPLNDPRRMRFEGSEFYLKDAAAMRAAMDFLPGDLQEQALNTTWEIAEKCRFDLNVGKLLMPHYPLPPEFKDMDAYLRHMVFEGAKKRWTEVSPDVEERLNHELGIIKEMGYAGYFLIVEDFTTAARKMDVIVGPARGSAAGSAVAYTLGITNIDPLKYDLLFERFLNPERITMPDIDIDFDDRGRGKVIDYVVNKYGKENVCQIITFSRMGAKQVIRDVGRVLGISYGETNRIAKLIPDGPKVTLDQAFQTVKEFRALRGDSRTEIQKLLKNAQVLEGTVRHTSVHAAGMIIAPERVSNFIPVALDKTKGEEVLISQYDGAWVERFGLLKMDLLGLATLTILEDTRQNILASRGEEVDLYTIPLDDDKTYEIFRRGDTTGIFQFDGDGMRRWLTELQPTGLNDLIAMNALFRPGPMDLIPDYVRRKHGREEVTYLHPLLEPILEVTYGIPVFQEQVMQMAQLMAGYTLGAADVLRRAMGKKEKAVMAEQRVKFVSGARERDIHPQIAEKAFDMMEKFAGYGFNKSHSAAYALLAYQAAYLKANYMPEFLAAVMSHPVTKAGVINLLRSEAARRGIKLRPPSILHSNAAFTVEDGHVRFGLCAIKGVQQQSLREITEARQKPGKMQTLYDFLGHLDLKKVNEKTVENLARVGALDELEGHRAQLVASIKTAFTEVRSRQRNRMAGQRSLFEDVPELSDGSSADAHSIYPPLQMEAPWTLMEQLKEERSLTGVYISGHPLDDFEVEARSLANGNLGDEELHEAAENNTDRRGPHHKRLKKTFCGIITTVQERTTRKGERMLIATLEDYTGSGTVLVWPKDMPRFESIVKMGEILLITGGLQRRGGNLEILSQEIVSLRTIRDSKIKSVVVRMDAAKTTQEQLSRFAELCNENRGGSRLDIALVDRKIRGGILHLRSRKLRVQPSSDLYQRLGDLFEARNITVKASLR